MAHAVCEKELDGDAGRLAAANDTRDAQSGHHQLAHAVLDVLAGVQRHGHEGKHDADPQQDARQALKGRQDDPDGVQVAKAQTGEEEHGEQRADDDEREDADRDVERPVKDGRAADLVVGALDHVDDRGRRGNEGEQGKDDKDGPLVRHAGRHQARRRNELQLDGRRA